jgi:glucose-6-phosphate isomerase
VTKKIDETVMLRLWAKDKTLFGSDMLDWIDEPARLQKNISALEKVSDSAKKRFSYFVLLGMGGSSAAPKMFKELLSPKSPFFILDSIHPHEVSKVESLIDIEKTLFIVASKSGSTMEPLLLYQHFLKKLEKTVTDPFSHFMAITDPISPLEQISVENGFLHAPLGRPLIGGRYSGLSVFGLLPAMLMGIDIKPILDSALNTAKNSGFSLRPEHEVIKLARIMASFDQKNFLIYLSPKLLALKLWIEQLMAESLGKNGRGIIPIIVEKGPANVALVLENEHLPKAEWCMSLGSAHEVGGLMFALQMAVALTGYLLDINPFDQPDVERSKNLTKEIIEKLEKKIPLAEYKNSTGFLSNQPGHYCAILSYLPEDAKTLANLDLLKQALEPYFGEAIMVQQGPRYLHSTGQLFKGGPDTGHFILLTGPYETDFKNASNNLSMADAHLSQALGDLAAMHELQRKIIHIREQSVQKIMGELCK